MRFKSVVSIGTIAGVLPVLVACGSGLHAFDVTPNAVTPMVRTPATESVIHSFGAPGDGAVPGAGLIDAGGTLYGTTTLGGRKVGSLCNVTGCGTVFSVAPDGEEAVVHAFTGPDGADPSAGLVDASGVLYGTTSYGGVHGQGTVFSVTRSGKERVLHSFGRIPDGQMPASSLVAAAGELYGTTPFGGANDTGCVFTISRSGREKVLYSFKGGSYGDGAYPDAGLTEVGGKLYGTTGGGGSGAGTVFEITLTGKERVLYRFALYGGDGKGPNSPLVARGGTFYGTTLSGGTNDFGTVFSVTRNGRERVLHRFRGVPDGLSPFGGLVDVGGIFYGTTWQGGMKSGESDAGVGTIFSIEPSGKERVVYAFAGAPDAALVPAGLIEVNGALYGVASSGGAYPEKDCPAGYADGCGAVFKLTL